MVNFTFANFMDKTGVCRKAGNHLNGFEKWKELIFSGYSVKRNSRHTV